MGLQCTWLLILLLACTYSITNVTIDPFPKNWLKFKCCKENEIIAKKKCQSLVSKDDTAMNSTDNNLTKLKCKDFALIQHTEWDDITENGSLYNSNKSKIIASPGTFCMYIINGTNNYISLIICQSPKTDPKNPKPRKSIEPRPTFELILYMILITMSALFSFITILVYILIKDLRNLFGKSLISYQVTMCVVDYFSILGFWPNDDEGAPRCNFIISAYLFYYSAMASAFWINVISFDVWWTFSGYRPYRSIYENENKRFLIYSMYAWGFPFLFSMILCCIEYIKPINDMVTIRPDFSLDKKCRLKREAIMLYLYGPMAIITIINILMFIHTSIRINKGLRERKNNFKKQDKLTFMKYLKLFMVMGVSFTIEIISGLIEIYQTNIDSIIKITFDYLNCINMLNGVIIFILFVCTKSVLELTNKQFCTRFQLFKPNNNNINNTSRSTCATPSFTRSKL